MERRIIIFLVLSLIIISSYPYFLAKFAPPPQPPNGTPPAPAVGVPTSLAKEGVAPSRSVPMPTNNEPSASVTETFKVIDGDLYRVVLSSRGGVIKEWALKKYTKKNDKGVAENVKLISPKSLVAPLSISVLEDDSFKDQTYSLDATTVRLSASKPQETVVMKAVASDGRSLTKELTFHNDQYQADIKIKADRFQKGYQLALGSNFGITDWTKSFGGAIGAITMIDGKVISEHPKMTTVTHESGATWFGLTDKYFMSALIPTGGGVPVSVQGIADTEISASIKIPGDPLREDKFILYAGPKEYDRLVSYHKFLEESIDFGWFIFGSWLPVRLVAKPLFYVLRFIYNITQNYGIAIILLTIFVKVLFHPVTKKSLVSMKEMASLQPKVTLIREKWADNKEKMNKELMNLYQEAGVNPFGGCLPMLLQMPVFVALFNVLSVTIDLKGAPFMLWVTDLSDKDPYYVLPVIMGATMIIQQMTQPKTMDPTQAKMMMFMPVIYTFFFLKFPSGLVLYWLVNNLLSIAQQYWINKQTTAVATT
ncbi:MAG: membrane protein insertase YidC [Nitrospirae bacterium]|nr:membrane protein insertase YidC [Candidatus Troglogloeales bacterium]